MSKRSWRSEVEFKVQGVKSGQITVEQAINGLEVSLLYDRLPDKFRRTIDFGSFEIGTCQESFDWLSRLRRYRFVKFFGFVNGRFWFGIILGSKESAEQKLQEQRYEILRDAK